MRYDWTVIALGSCLVCSIAATCTIVILEGSTALAGTGLGALTTLLAGALAVRVKNTNGK